MCCIFMYTDEKGSSKGRDHSAKCEHPSGDGQKSEVVPKLKIEDLKKEKIKSEKVKSEKLGLKIEKVETLKLSEQSQKSVEKMAVVKGPETAQQPILQLGTETGSQDAIAGYILVPINPMQLPFSMMQYGGMMPMQMPVQMPMQNLQMPLISMMASGGLPQSMSMFGSLPGMLPQMSATGTCQTLPVRNFVFLCLRGGYYQEI